MWLGQFQYEPPYGDDRDGRRHGDNQVDGMFASGRGAKENADQKTQIQPERGDQSIGQYE